MEEEKKEYDDIEARVDFILEMEAQGYVICYPEPDELFIDIDTLEQYAVYERQLELLLKWYPGATYIRTTSKSGDPRMHVRVRVPSKIFDDESRIAWQSALGSDPTREFMSLMRVEREVPDPTIFVEPKEVLTVLKKLL